MSDTPRPQLVRGQKSSLPDIVGELTATVSRLAAVVKNLAQMAADETMPAHRAGTWDSRERARMLRESLDACATIKQEISEIEKSLTT